MEFRVLGALEARDDAGQLQVIPRGMPRVLLAALLCNAGAIVSVDALTTYLWDENPPAQPRRALQVTAVRLRQAMPSAMRARLTTIPPGYRMVVEPGELDLHRFEELYRLGVAAHAERDWLRTVELLQSALACWRGDPLADVESARLEMDVSVALREQRLDALRRRIDADLALGRHDHVIGELARVVEAHPLDERLRGQLLLALSRAGRRADALRAFQDGRRHLVAELGVEPGPDLQRIHLMILRDEQEPPPAPAPVLAEPRTVPRALPPDLYGFVGRADTLALLDGILSEEGMGVAVSAIAGTAGVGKTALAVHWAHRVAPRFPDGQLFVDLAAHSGRIPTRPAEALGVLLRTLGMPAEKVPADLAEATAQYRSLVAGRRMLIVLDNATSAEQVRPLLPGTSSCLVLVTSRQRLSGLVARDGARRIALDVLDEADARVLLALMLGQDRITAEPAAVTELIEVCARLPLALRIAAAHLLDRPSLSVAVYLAELRARCPVVALSVDGDEGTAISVAFAQSYQALTETARLVFRRLGLVALAAFAPSSVARLAGLAEQEAGRALDQLADAHLVNAVESGSYTLHDLLRGYATVLAEEDHRDDREEAVGRLFTWYVETARTAQDIRHPNALTMPRPATTPGGPVTDRDSALAWLTLEHRNMLIVSEHAVRCGPLEIAWQLTDALRSFYSQRRLMDEWVRSSRAALAAARQAGDPLALAVAFFSLAQVRYSRAHIHRALAYLKRAHDMSLAADWGQAQRTILHNLALTLKAHGRTEEAAERLRSLIDLCRDDGREHQLSRAMEALANVYRDAGRLAEGLDTAERSLALRRENEQPGIEEASIMATIGELHHDAGRLATAEAYLSTALAHHRAQTSLYGDAETLGILGRVHRDQGRMAEAEQCALASIAIATQISEPQVEASSRVLLASMLSAAGDHAGALRECLTAYELAVDFEGTYVMAVALTGLASARRGTGDGPGALADAERALDLARENRYRVVVGQAMTLLAELHGDLDDIERAVELATAALEQHRRTGHRQGEAQAHAVLGRVLAKHDPDQAEAHAREAVRIRAGMAAGPG